MEQEVRKQRKRREEPRLEFQAGKVFGPEEAKGEDFNYDPQQDLDAATYRARKGEGGDRNQVYERIRGLI